jgi:hypothetical protein
VDFDDDDLPTGIASWWQALVERLRLFGVDPNKDRIFGSRKPDDGLSNQLRHARKNATDAEWLRAKATADRKYQSKPETKRRRALLQRARRLEKKK